LRGDSISSDILDVIKSTNIQVTATEKGSQINETFLVLQPSHTSMIHQPLDNGINAMLQQMYNKCYTSNIAINPQSKIDNSTRMRILCTTINNLKI